MFYSGWWQYDERTCQEIEDAYKKSQKQCTILVAGNLYVVDFDQMLQKRQSDPSRKRQVKSINNMTLYAISNNHFSAILY